MTRDTIKTILGLVVIILIVGATFLYGNAQRQAQLRRDNDVKKQQVADATPTPHVTATPTPKPTATPTPTAAPVTTSSNGSIPDTGASLDALIGVLALSIAGGYWYRGQRAVRVAVRTRR